MAIRVNQIPYQIELDDATKREYPNEAVVRLAFQQLTNVPALVANKMVVTNNEGTAIGFEDKPPGTGSVTFTLVTDFPASPTNNQIVLLTQSQGTNAVGFYQYQTNRWVALFIRSTSVSLPVGTTLPTVATAGSLFFLSQTYLTNSPGVYFRNAGPPAVWVAIATAEDNSALSQSITALTARVTTLEGDNPVTALALSGNTLTVTKKDNTTEDFTLPSGGGGTAQLATASIYYGNTALKSDTDDDADAIANARTEATTAFNANNGGTLKSVTLQTGGYVSITYPATEGYYRPYIAIPTASIQNIVIQSFENNFETSEWTTVTATLNAINYTIYVKVPESQQGEVDQWIIKNYS